MENTSEAAPANQYDSQNEENQTQNGNYSNNDRFDNNQNSSDNSNTSSSQYQDQQRTLIHPAPLEHLLQPLPRHLQERLQQLHPVPRQPKPLQLGL